MAIFGKKHDESEEIQLFESTENEKTFFFANQKTLVRLMIVSFVQLDKIQSAMLCCKVQMGKNLYYYQRLLLTN